MQEVSRSKSILTLNGLFEVMTSEDDDEEGLGAEERSLMFAGKDDKGGDYYEVMILQKVRRSLSIMMLTVIRDAPQKHHMR